MESDNSKVRATRAGSDWAAEAVRPVLKKVSEGEDPIPFHKLGRELSQDLHLILLLPSSYYGNLRLVEEYFTENIGTYAQFRESLRRLFEAGYIEFSSDPKIIKRTK